MKKLMKKAIVTTLVFGLAFGAGSITEASSAYTVQSGDSLYKIGMKYGVSYESIKELNNLESEMISPGQKLDIPDSISSTEMDLLARLVSAEAKGEPYAGKVAVATVVLNRVDHPEFPDSIKEVIYSQNEFTPVQNGEINKPADEESVKAVREALSFGGQGNGSIYFYNPKTSTSDWIFTRDVIVELGNHRFAK